MNLFLDLFADRDGPEFSVEGIDVAEERSGSPPGHYQRGDCEQDQSAGPKTLGNPKWRLQRRACETAELDALLQRRAAAPRHEGCEGCEGNIRQQIESRLAPAG